MTQNIDAGLAVYDAAIDQLRLAQFDEPWKQAHVNDLIKKLIRRRNEFLFECQDQGEEANNAVYSAGRKRLDSAGS